MINIPHYIDLLVAAGAIQIKDLNLLESELNELNVGRDSITININSKDIRRIAETLSLNPTDEQCLEILQNLQNDFDMNRGITNDMIEAEILYCVT